MAHVKYLAPFLAAEGDGCWSGGSGGGGTPVVHPGVCECVTVSSDPGVRLVCRGAELWEGGGFYPGNLRTTRVRQQSLTRSPAIIDIERVVDSQLSASIYTRKPNMLRHACAEFR